MDDSRKSAGRDLVGRTRYRKTISTSSPVTDMFRKLSQNVGKEIKASQLSNTDRSKIINMERAKPDVPPPQWFPLSEKELYHEEGSEMPDHFLLKKHLREEGRLTNDCAIALLSQACDVIRDEPNMLNLTEHLPLRICGDLHGQFYDLLNLLDMAGDPEDDNFIFLGDYVDRGMFSTEVVLYLAALKVNFPNNLFMLRGNHECRLLTSHFNFMDEFMHKYDAEVYYMFMELFDVLPVAAFVENNIGRFLMVHGGISPELDDLDDIQAIDRFVEPAGEGIMCDLLWADPIDEATGEGLTEEEMLEWDSVDYIANPDRGCSWIFGYSGILEFLQTHNLVSVIRAHEVQKAGFKEHFFLKEGQREHPLLITVFSAPNYCDMYNNKAAFMIMDDDTYEFKQTVHVGHPYNLPNFMDGLSYSLPYVMENLSMLAEDIMTICLPKEGEDIPETEKDEVERLRQKILGLSRLRHVMANLGEDRRKSITIPKVMKTSEGSRLKKFEAALQMDFMKEYLKPGMKTGIGSGKAPMYRGRSKSLNFLEMKKGLITPENMKFGFLNEKRSATKTTTMSEKTEGGRSSNARRNRARAVKFDAPPDLTGEEEEEGNALLSEKEKKKLRRKSKEAAF